MIESTSTSSRMQPPAAVPARPPAGPAGNPPAVPPKRSSKLKWLWLPVLVVLAWLGYKYWPKIGPLLSGPAAPASSKGKKGGKGGGGAIPVVATRAHRGNIGVYDVSLGAVTAIYTVTVKTVVDGQLMSVMYKEGDLVQKGQILAQIDPRPYEVQLENAEGQLAKDQAALANARVDLTRYETLVTQKAVPEQQLATQKALVDQDVGTVKSDEAHDP